MKREFFHAILNPRYKAQRFSNSWDEGLGPGQRLRIAVPEGGAVRQDTTLFGVWQRGPRTFTGQCVPSLQERRRVRGSQSGSQRIPRRPRPRLGLGKARASPGAGLSSHKVITTCQKLLLFCITTDHFGEQGLGIEKENCFKTKQNTASWRFPPTPFLFFFFKGGRIKKQTNKNVSRHLLTTAADFLCKRKPCDIP